MRSSRIQNGEFWEFPYQRPLLRGVTEEQASTPGSVVPWSIPPHEDVFFWSALVYLAAHQPHRFQRSTVESTVDLFPCFRPSLRDDARAPRSTTTFSVRSAASLKAKQRKKVPYTCVIFSRRYSSAAPPQPPPSSNKRQKRGAQRSKHQLPLPTSEPPSAAPRTPTAAAAAENQCLVLGYFFSAVCAFTASILSRIPDTSPR